MTHRYLPSDVSSDIHQIIAKAIHARLIRLMHEDPRFLIKDGSVIFSREELNAAAESQFEYDVADDGSILFRPARD